MAAFYLILLFLFIIIGGFTLIPMFPNLLPWFQPASHIYGAKPPLGIDGISMWYSSQYVYRYESSICLFRFLLSDFSFIHLYRSVSLWIRLILWELLSAIPLTYWIIVSAILSNGLSLLFSYYPNHNTNSLSRQDIELSLLDWL